MRSAVANWYSVCDMGELRLQQDGDDVLLWIKAVPGASRDEVAGLIGERLKVRTCIAPERGKANKAICAIVARALGVKAGQIDVYTGHTNPEKVVRVASTTMDQVRRRLQPLESE